MFLFKFAQKHTIIKSAVRVIYHILKCTFFWALCLYEVKYLFYLQTALEIPKFIMHTL